MVLPNRLRLRDGVLCMADGSDVKEYLGSRQKAGGYGADEPMVLITRRAVEAMQRDAGLWRLQKAQQDESYMLCA